MSIDVGEVCIYCHESVAFGSGRFVNRIPAGDGIVDGYMCAECQHDPDTDECNCDACAEGTFDEDQEEADGQSST